MPLPLPLCDGEGNESITSTEPPPQQAEANKPFRLFSNKKPKSKTLNPTNPGSPNPIKTSQIDHGDPDPNPIQTTFSSLSLPQWCTTTLSSLSIRRPTAVQRRCIPRILAGDDVLAIAATGSGKTAAFALPIIAKLAEDPYGIFALVITPSRELGVQLIEQFRAFGVGLNLRCWLVVGGMGMETQAKGLLQRPHVVVATPGRIRYLMADLDIAKAFSKAKFLVLDEADRLLDVCFEEDLRVIFKCLPKNRQTLLFSATKTSTLQALHDISPNSTYFYEEYEGLTTVESLKQQYIFIPKNVKDVYLHHILSRMEDSDIRSAIVFVATCKTCYLLKSLLDVLDLKVVSLNSLNSQSERLSSLNRFKSGQVPILIATDLASRGLDIPTVDLIINYDIPRDPPDYVHRVGRTARAGRGGLSISFITQNDINLIHAIEAEIKKQLDAYECKEEEVLEAITKVYKARRVARMKMSDEGYEEKAEARKQLDKRRRESADEPDT